MVTLKTIIYLAIALAVFFVMATTLIIPYFANSYEYGFGTPPCAKTGCTSTADNLINAKCLTKGGLTSCSNCNSSTGYSTFLTTCYSLVAWNNITDCYACSAFNSYNTATSGMILFIFVIGLISIAVTFMKYVKISK